MPVKTGQIKFTTIEMTIFSICGIILLVFACISTFPPGGPDSLAAETYRGGRIFIMVFPNTKGRPQEKVTLFDNQLYTNPHQAFHLIDDSKQGGRFVSISNVQWEAIDTLRQRWCNTAPLFPSPSENEPFMDIGIHCKNINGTFARNIRIPMSGIPTEVQDFLVLVTER